MDEAMIMALLSLWCGTGGIVFLVFIVFTPKYAVPTIIFTLILAVIATLMIIFMDTILHCCCGIGEDHNSRREQEPLMGEKEGENEPLMGASAADA
jgi:hypothetical protein